MGTNIYFTNKILLQKKILKCEVTIDYLGYQIIGIQDKLN